MRRVEKRKRRPGHVDHVDDVDDVGLYATFLGPVVGGIVFRAAGTAAPAAGAAAATTAATAAADAVFTFPRRSSGYYFRLIH